METGRVHTPLLAAEGTEVPVYILVVRRIFTISRHPLIGLVERCPHRDIRFACFVYQAGSRQEDTCRL